MSDNSEPMSATRWIAVTDRLPENHERVLIAFGPVAAVGWRIHDLWRNALDVDENYQARWLSVVTHWMPLPEPPKEPIKL